MTQATTLEAPTESAAVHSSAFHACIFRRGGRLFAIHASAVTQVSFVPDVTPVPGTASFLQGAINLRGDIVPVVCIDDAIGIPATPFSPRSPILILQARLGMAAILVDKVVTVAHVHEIVNRGDVQGKDEAAHVVGLCTFDDQLVTVLDHEKLLQSLQAGLLGH